MHLIRCRDAALLKEILTSPWSNATYSDTHGSPERYNGIAFVFGDMDTVYITNIRRPKHRSVDEGLNRRDRSPCRRRILPPNIRHLLVNGSSQKTTVKGTDLLLFLLLLFLGSLSCSTASGSTTTAGNSDSTTGWNLCNATILVS